MRLYVGLGGNAVLLGGFERAHDNQRHGGEKNQIGKAVRFAAESAQAEKLRAFRQRPQHGQAHQRKHRRARGAHFGDFFEHQPIIDARYPALVNRVVDIVDYHAGGEKGENQNAAGAVSGKQIRRGKSRNQRECFRDLPCVELGNVEHHAVSQLAQCEQRAVCQYDK